MPTLDNTKTYNTYVLCADQTIENRFGHYAIAITEVQTNTCTQKIPNCPCVKSTETVAFYFTLYSNSIPVDNNNLNWPQKILQKIFPNAQITHSQFIENAKDDYAIRIKQPKLATTGESNIADHLSKESAAALSNLKRLGYNRIVRLNINGTTNIQNIIDETNKMKTQNVKWAQWAAFLPLRPYLNTHNASTAIPQAIKKGMCAQQNETVFPILGCLSLLLLIISSSFPSEKYPKLQDCRVALATFLFVRLAVSLENAYLYANNLCEVTKTPQNNLYYPMVFMVCAINAAASFFTVNACREIVALPNTWLRELELQNRIVSRHAIVDQPAHASKKK